MAFQSIRPEMNVTSKPIELGYNENGAALPAFGKGGVKLGSVVLSAALHFDKLRGKFSPALHKSGYSLALRVHAKTLDALLVRGYSKVSDVFRHFPLPVLFSNVRLIEYTTISKKEN
jgi:hypothetical protein